MEKTKERKKMKSFGKIDSENRSDKCCCCGGHSASDHKKSLTHHSTLAKLIIRQKRQNKALDKAIIEGRLFVKEKLGASVHNPKCSKGTFDA